MTPSVHLISRLAVLAAALLSACAPLSSAPSGTNDLSVQLPSCRDLPSCKDSEVCEDSLRDLTIRLNASVLDDEAFIDFVSIPKNPVYRVLYSGLNKRMHEAWNARDSSAKPSSALRFVSTFDGGIVAVLPETSSETGTAGLGLPVLGEDPALLKRLITSNDEGGGRHWQHTFVVGNSASNTSAFGFHFRRQLPPEFLVLGLRVSSDGGSGPGGGATEDLSRAFQAELEKRAARPPAQLLAAGGAILTALLTKGKSLPSSIGVLAKAAGVFTVATGSLATGIQTAGASTLCEGDQAPPDIGVAQSLFLRELRRSPQDGSRGSLTQAFYHLNHRLGKDIVSQWSDPYINALDPEDPRQVWLSTLRTRDALMRSLTRRGDPNGTLEDHGVAATEECKDLETGGSLFYTHVVAPVMGDFKELDKAYLTYKDASGGDAQPPKILTHKLLTLLRKINVMCDKYQEDMTHNQECVGAMLDAEFQKLLGQIVEGLYNQNRWFKSANKDDEYGDGMEPLDEDSYFLEHTIQFWLKLAVQYGHALHATDAHHVIQGALSCIEKVAGTDPVEPLEGRGELVRPPVEWWWKRQNWWWRR